MRDYTREITDINYRLSAIEDLLKELLKEIKKKES